MLLYKMTSITDEDIEQVSKSIVEMFNEKLNEKLKTEEDEEINGNSNGKEIEPLLS